MEGVDRRGFRPAILEEGSGSDGAGRPISAPFLARSHGSAVHGFYFSALRSMCCWRLKDETGVSIATAMRAAERTWLMPHVDRVVPDGVGGARPRRPCAYRLLLPLGPDALAASRVRIECLRPHCVRGSDRKLGHHQHQHARRFIGVLHRHGLPVFGRGLSSFANSSTCSSIT